MNFFLSIVCLLFFSGNQDISTVRENYIQASQSKEKANEFNELMVNYTGENKTMLAYKGASIALKAKFATDRKTKKELFTKGITILEQAVKADSNNAEIRLIRLSIQENTPKILNYKANISEDKKLILKEAKNGKTYLISGKYQIKMTQKSYSQSTPLNIIRNEKN